MRMRGTDFGGHGQAAARGRRRGGFTLLELLIATAVGGIVLLVVQTAFFGALRLHTTTHARNDEDLELQRALGIIRRDFAGLLLPGGVLSNHLQTTAFSSGMTDDFGERVSPDLYTSSGRIDGWTPFADAQMVALFLAEPEDRKAAGKDLVRVVRRNLLPVQEEAGEPQVLLHGVAEAYVEFFDGAGWIEEWDSEATSMLPAAVKLRLVLAAPDPAGPAPQPIELVVPVLVKTSASAAAEAEMAAGEGL
jgi:prepilin-type N-terminal cleavage/methylation domain-containing protein